MAHKELTLSDEPQVESRILIGFKKQAEYMSGPITKVINRVRIKHDTAIIEGVNMISSELLKSFPTDRYSKILLVNLFVEDEKVHLERIRRKGGRSMEPPELTDKYVLNLSAIREIDKFLKEDSVECSKRYPNIISIENSISINKAVQKVDMYIKEVKKWHKGNRGGW